MDKPKKAIQPNQLYATTEFNIKKFIKEKRGGDSLLLYFAYQQQAVWQETNQPWATDKFMIKKLKWGKARFATAVATLKKMGFIERIPYKKKGIIEQWFVKVNYIMNVGLLNNQNHRNQDTGNGVINALNNPKDKLKCLKEEKRKIHEVNFALLSSSFGISKENVEEQIFVSFFPEVKKIA